MNGKKFSLPLTEVFLCVIMIFIILAYFNGWDN
jgi:uncharacterized membrane protein (DUF485 family)